MGALRGGRRRRAGLALGLVIACVTPGQAAGALPAWVDGQDPAFSTAVLLLAVGQGTSRKAADVDALAGISRIFEAQVVSVLEDYQAAASVVNSSGKGVQVEVQQTREYQRVVTGKTLEGVELVARAEEKGQYFTLATLSRERCVRSLRARIEALDGEIARALESDRDGELAMLRAAGRALELLDERQGLDAMLRVCDPRGEGVRATVTFSELAARFEAAAGALRLGLRVRGAGASRVRDCLAAALGERGLPLEAVDLDEEVSGESDDEDEEAPEVELLLDGKVRSEKAGEIAGSVMVRTELTLRLVDLRKKKVLRTFGGQRKEGRADVKASAALAAFKLCQVEVPKIVQALDAAMKR
jgi:hypothetical protein